LQGHFALTAGLLPALRASSPSRVVSISSAAHCLLTPDTGLYWDRLDAHAGSALLARTYEPWEAYGMSKLAMLLHARELQRRSDAGGWGVTALAVHPGAILGTGLKRHVGLRTLGRMVSHARLWSFVFFSERPLTKTTRQGVATALVAALDPSPVPGGYYSDCKPVPPGSPYISPLADDPAVGERLWQATEALSAPGAKARMIGGESSRIEKAAEGKAVAGSVASH
jgi:NAD(P)-dependent dehydrogenase (short-subunit alcohol dehydrogenase family)